MVFHIKSIEGITQNNTKFMSVAHTNEDEDIQITVQNLSANQRIPWETHYNVTQIVQVVEGFGFIYTKRTRLEISRGSLAVIDSGTNHEIVAGDEGMKFFSIYTGVVH